MKSIITAGLLLGAAHGLTAPAMAGVYGNVETNAGITGGEYQGATTEVHLGVEGEIGSATVYAQGGPALVAVEGVDGTELEYSGKAGIGIPILSYRQMVRKLLILSLFKWPYRMQLVHCQSSI